MPNFELWHSYRKWAIYAFSGSRSRDPRNTAAADLNLTPQGLQDRYLCSWTSSKIQIITTMWYKCSDQHMLLHGSRRSSVGKVTTLRYGWPKNFGSFAGRGKRNSFIFQKVHTRSWARPSTYSVGTASCSPGSRGLGARSEIPQPSAEENNT